MTISPGLPLREDFWWERNDLHYHDDRLQFAGHDVGALAAEADGPLYLYSLDRVAAKLDTLLQALDGTECTHRVYYAMKANRFAPLLKMMARSGKCGVDICSPNELDLALSCGFAAKQISFTGTGVANRDLDRLLVHPELVINCDSIGMIRRIGERAPGRAIGIRVNPGLGTGYGDSALLTYAGARTTKFGIYREQWAEALDMARRFDLKVTTLHFHVGCGYLDGQLASWEEAVAAALSSVAELPDLEMVNVGGGLGLPHRAAERPLDLTRWSAILRSHFSGTGLTVAVEPGDFLVKDAGMLVLGVTDVERKRDTLFVSVDGGFNLHPEPAFYDMPCEPVACFIRSRDPADWQSATIAGNINEALDIWGEAVAVPPLFEEDHIALLNAGGYGASMSSNHCMRGDYTEIAL
ncbi:diaminopimelate decarboxylase [Parasphingorhabdus sp.]|uniref:diaminopimelate decarboxylase n=1 Tax=Parasphingorhabdus sp. TaxID=2709688 RepID=UPI003A8ED352